LIPVIARADTLTEDELIQSKCILPLIDFFFKKTNIELKFSN